MEALSAVEAEEKRRNQLGGQLEQQVSQLKRDLSSPHASSLHALLQESLVLNGRLLNDILNRLATIFDLAAQHAELIPLDPETLRASLATRLVKEPTDNLILTTVLRHAATHVDPVGEVHEQSMVFLSGNTRDFDVEEVKAVLKAGGLRYMSSTRSVLELAKAEAKQ